MNLFRLILREIAFRKISFVTSLLSVIAAVACLALLIELLADHDAATESIVEAKTAEQREILQKHEAKLIEITKEHEDFTRKNMKNLGFNILILPKNQNLGDLYADDFASKYMPEEYVHTLANSKIVTINHLLPSLTQKLVWPERKRTIILIGVRGEVPIAHKNPKKPLIDPVPKGSAVLGSELCESLGLKPGDKIELLGEEFSVHKCYPARGNKDDITIWIDLATSQRLLDKKDKINAILALECNCTADRLPIIRSEIAGILPETQVIERGTKATVRAEGRQKAKKLAEETLAIAKRETSATLAAAEAGRLELRRGRERAAATTIPTVIFGSALLVAVLAFLNVRERRSEIGILRALGLGGGSVLQVFLAKASVIGLIGAVVGYPLGHVLATAWGESSLARGEGGSLFDPTLFGLTLVAAPIVAITASWIPALLASQQDPADVLRDS